MRESQIILLAKDNAEDANLIKSTFEQTGLIGRFLTVHDGEQALHYLSATGHYSDRSKYLFPQLVLLDLKMPRVSGLELLAWLRGQPLWRKPARHRHY